MFWKWIVPSLDWLISPPRTFYISSGRIFRWFCSE